MPPPSSKKRSAMMVVLRGNGAEHGAPGDDVGDELLRAAGADAALFHEPCDGRGHLGLRGRDVAGRHVGRARGDLLAQFADAVAQNGGALRRFAEPEGQRGRRAVSIFDEDAACGFDALNAPAGVAEQDDVAGAGVDGEVLVERGDLHAFGLQDDAEERGVGDGAAVGDGDHARAAARMKLAAGCRRAAGMLRSGRGWIRCRCEQRDELVEALAGEVAIRIGAAEHVVERVFFPRLGSAAGDDLLHEHVDGLRRNFELVEFAGAHLADERGLFQQIVARGGEEAAFGNGSAPVAGAADALHGDGNGARGADLADEVDVADVDAEFERGGGDQDLDLAALQALLGIEAERCARDEP